MTSGFDAKVTAGYDDQITKMIPGYDVLHRLVDVCLSEELPAQANLLMVGAGTGAEVLECGLRHPGWTMTAVEPSLDMSALGMKKIKAQGLVERVHWHDDPLKTLDPGEPFDAATLILVLHFLPNYAEKVDLLSQIADRLKPGAPFILSTYVGDPTTTRTKKMYELNQAWAIAQGVDPQTTQENISVNRKDVFLIPEEKVKILLRDSGFIDVQRLYQALAMQAWIARTNR